MYQVIKRDGEIVAFDINKIAAAVKKAFEATNTDYTDSVIDFLALKVSADFLPKIRIEIVVDDTDVDVEYHVRHIALPQPGDWRQLMIQVARLHSRSLDMSKPLWEAYIIEGLDHVPGIAPGSFALYIKFHHAAVDGEGGVEIIRAIHSLSPTLDPEEGAGASANPVAIIADRDPTGAELCARAVGHRASQVRNGARLLFLYKEVLGVELPWLSKVEAAKTSRRVSSHENDPK